MKILLVGEFSRLHNSLKEGLLSLNHTVSIIGSGDDFKEFPVDYSITPRIFLSSSLLKFFNKVFFKLFKSDLRLLERGIRFYLLLPKLKNYDIVQLINSDAIETYPFASRYLLNKLFHQNKKISLLICGEDTPIIEYLLKNEMKYSILNPLIANQNLKKDYNYSLKYIQPNYRKTFDFIKEKSSSIITSDLDYKIPMEAMGLHSQFIPNPINTDKIEYKPLIINAKIIIFLGINESSAVKKGSMFFEKALVIIKEKYPTQVETVVTRSIPYQQYIEAYNKAHILLDQVYSYDQGYNALEAMAKGKVVFTGAENEFSKQYHLTEKVTINALPNVDSIVEELSFLIENPDELIAIGKRARRFVEKEHHYIKIAEKYLETWNK
ncbi:glycosyltransferase [Flavobacterium franklandianum]|uniref:Glycosyltransferase family 1 protein n=1 Tax=Flavobacterium franklandianum TaxID=2594430 RepID=A0A553C7V2_9FLAO|nr:glycosyltransferase [Flavobacterium franklandianum]TRX16590.1 glycosyltransferase family 1 protein [Flavobacterium franklandianum]